MNEKIVRNEHELRAFLRDIENNTIDKSEWIKRGDAEKLVERQQQRMEGINTIAEILILRGFLEPEAVDYGYTLMELRNAFLGALNAKSAAWSLLQSFLGGAEPKNYADRMYEDIIRQITLSTQRSIESALFGIWPINGLECEVSNGYRIEFIRLMNATDEVVKKIKDDIAKELAYA